jgi:hypothetical protein
MRRLGLALAALLLAGAGVPALTSHVVPVHSTLHERAAVAHAMLVVRIVTLSAAPRCRVGSTSLVALKLVQVVEQALQVRGQRRFE